VFLFILYTFFMSPESLLHTDKLFVDSPEYKRHERFIDLLRIDILKSLDVLPDFRLKHSGVIANKNHILCDSGDLTVDTLRRCYERSASQVFANSEGQKSTDTESASALLERLLAIRLSIFEDRNPDRKSQQPVSYKRLIGQVKKLNEFCCCNAIPSPISHLYHPRNLYNFLIKLPPFDDEDVEINFYRELGRLCARNPQYFRSALLAVNHKNSGACVETLIYSAFKVIQSTAQEPIDEAATISHILKSGKAYYSALSSTGRHNKLIELFQRWKQKNDISPVPVSLFLEALISLERVEEYLAYVILNPPELQDFRRKNGMKFVDMCLAASSLLCERDRQDAGEKLLKLAIPNAVDRKAASQQLMNTVWDRIALSVGVSDEPLQ
jgi:hypothetical protein